VMIFKPEALAHLPPQPTAPANRDKTKGVEDLLMGNG